MTAKIYIDRDAHLMMQYAIHEDPNLELGGLAKVTVDNSDRSEETITIKDIWIPEQVIGSAHADLFSKDPFKLITQLQERKEKLSDWRCWWHSHAKMSVGSSGQDDETLILLAQEINSWFLGLIVNTKGEYSTRLTWAEPITASMGGLDVSTWTEEDAELKGKVLDMLKNVEKGSRNTGGSASPASQWQGGYYQKPSGMGHRPAGKPATEHKEEQREKDKPKPDVKDYRPGDFFEYGGSLWTWGADNCWHFQAKDSANGEKSISVPAENLEAVLKEEGVEVKPSHKRATPVTNAIKERGKENKKPKKPKPKAK
jgi:hypothetical protein